MLTIDVFADIACPFAHVGLRRFVAERERRGRPGPTLRVRAWPLEIVNQCPMDGPTLTPKVEALRQQVAPDLFAGFSADRFPRSTLPALAAEVAAHRLGSDVGERFSLAVRAALFDHGLAVDEPGVLTSLLAEAGVPEPTDDDRAAVLADHQEGEARGVVGSPHFFTPAGDFFCPSLDIRHDDGGYDIRFDIAGFERFTAAVFA